MAPPLIQLSDILLTFGGTPLLDGAELSVASGERVALVGRNGSGKSTLLKIAAGLVEMDRGTRFVQPGATIRYLPQEPDLAGFATTRAYVESGLGPADSSHAAGFLLEQLGLSADADPIRLSGGEARRAALARVLAADPDIILLDEPTNHLDLPAIEWLEEDLARRRAALVLISHDRRFLQNLSRTTVWLDRGQTRRIERGFADFESWRDEILAEEDREQHKLGRKIAAEEDWLRYGVTARRKRNMRRLGELMQLRAARRAYRGAAGKAEIVATEAERSGTFVIEAQGIGKSYEGRPLVSGFSIRIQRGDRIGIVGPNGTGKTTLVNMLSGALAPDTGAVRLGANLAIATLDQHRDSLDPETTLSDALTGGGTDTVTVGAQTRHVVGYMKDFLFAPEQARTPLRLLSGGERARLMLARLLAKPSNVLVLDEPTNDLDLETLDVLEEMLSAYSGTILLISHDRDFLDRIVNGVIVPEGKGRWLEYAGGYSDMLAQRRSDLPPTSSASASPGRNGGPAKTKADPRPVERARLSFNQQHALKTLPGTIARLEGQRRVLRERLEDPTLYARDRKAFEDASAKLAATDAEIAAAEDRWLELEMLRDEIEAGSRTAPRGASEGS
ncbi:MAG TPA: ABC-F family ATP-binding cassette domain-containing protein [Beijerinckiaceae bacterium]|jgi:ATP-binding cassette subfamily F protein uup